MPATVVIVHDDNTLTAQTKAALEQKGFAVAVYADSMAALPALEHARSADLLITRVNFGPAKPHGISLALMARTRRPKIKVLFVTQPENRQHTEDVGDFLAAPAAIEDIVAAAERALWGSGAAPLLIAQPTRQQRRVAAFAPVSAPVVRFSTRTAELIHVARLATERAALTLQLARELRSARNAPLRWCIEPMPL